MANKSKDKGSAFERAIAKRLTESFGEPFVRSAGSGAWLGGRNANREAPESVRRDRTGDIACPEGLPFLIECKRYRDIPDLFEPSERIGKWLDQLLEGFREGDIPILIFQGDRRPAMAMMEMIHGIHSMTESHWLRYRHRDVNWAVLKLDSALPALVSKFKTPLRDSLMAFVPPEGEPPEKPKGLASRRIPESVRRPRGGGFRHGSRDDQVSDE